MLGTIMSSKINSYLSSDFSSNVTQKPVACQERDPCEDCEVESLSGSDREDLTLVPHAPRAPRGLKTGRPQPSRESSGVSADSGVSLIDRDELEFLEKVGAGAAK